MAILNSWCQEFDDLMFPKKGKKKSVELSLRDVTSEELKEKRTEVYKYLIK